MSGILKKKQLGDYKIEPTGGHKTSFLQTCHWGWIQGKAHPVTATYGTGKHKKTQAGVLFL